MYRWMWWAAVSAKKWVARQPIRRLEAVHTGALAQSNMFSRP